MKRPKSAPPLNRDVLNTGSVESLAGQQRQPSATRPHGPVILASAKLSQHAALRVSAAAYLGRSKMKHFTVKVAGKPVAVVCAAELIMAEGFVAGEFEEGQAFREALIARRHVKRRDGFAALTVGMASIEEIDTFEQQFSAAVKARSAVLADEEHYFVWLVPAEPPKAATRNPD